MSLLIFRILLWKRQDLRLEGGGGGRNGETLSMGRQLQQVVPNALVEVGSYYSHLPCSCDASWCALPSPFHKYLHCMYVLQTEVSHPHVCSMEITSAFLQCSVQGRQLLMRIVQVRKCVQVPGAHSFLRTLPLYMYMWAGKWWIPANLFTEDCSDILPPEVHIHIVPLPHLPFYMLVLVTGC